MWLIVVCEWYYCMALILLYVISLVVCDLVLYVINYCCIRLMVDDTGLLTLLYVIAGALTVGLVRQCQTIHGRDRTCIPPRLPPEWVTTLFFIIMGIISLTVTCGLLVASHWRREATKYARWIAFTGSESHLSWLNVPLFWPFWEYVKWRDVKVACVCFVFVCFVYYYSLRSY